MSEKSSVGATRKQLNSRSNKHNNSKILELKNLRTEQVQQSAVHLVHHLFRGRLFQMSHQKAKQQSPKKKSSEKIQMKKMMMMMISWMNTRCLDQYLKTNHSFLLSITPCLCRSPLKKGSQCSWRCSLLIDLSILDLRSNRSEANTTIGLKCWHL